MTTLTAPVAIGLGANLGDRAAAIAFAAQRLSEHPQITSGRVSDPIETAAVLRPGAPPQPPYLNAAAKIETTLSPRKLLETLLEIERSAGRDRSTEPRWGARPLDLDLLLYGDAIIDEPGLTVPHPRMHRREFVLRPLAALWPDARHPVLGLTVEQLLERLVTGNMTP